MTQKQRPLDRTVERELIVFVIEHVLLTRAPRPGTAGVAIVNVVVAHNRAPRPRLEGRGSKNQKYWPKIDCDVLGVGGGFAQDPAGKR